MGLVEKWREIAKTLETGFQLDYSATGAHVRESARVRRQCADQLETRDKDIRAIATDLIGHCDDLARHLGREILEKLGG